jgi:hypothetical protein
MAFTEEIILSKLTNYIKDCFVKTLLSFPLRRWIKTVKFNRISLYSGIVHIGGPLLGAQYV